MRAEIDRVRRARTGIAAVGGARTSPGRWLGWLAGCAAIVAAPFVAGCAVVAVVATAATITAGVVSTAVDVGVGAAKVTGKVIGKGVDVVTGPATAPAPFAPAGKP